MRMKILAKGREDRWGADAPVFGTWYAAGRVWIGGPKRFQAEMEKVAGSWAGDRRVGQSELIEERRRIRFGIKAGEAEWGRWAERLEAWAIANGFELRVVRNFGRLIH